MDNLMLAFLLTALAGMSTTLGSAIAFFTKKTNTAVLSTGLSFSAGVMIYISFVELFDEGNEELVEFLGEGAGDWATIAAFFSGILLIALLDALLPDAHHFHDPVDELELEELSDEERKLKEDEDELHRVGVITALAIAVHNFPEGLITFVATLADPALGVTIAIAIAIHNIPEGIAVAVPIYHSTGSRAKAFGYSFIAGLAEPLGALLGYFVFRSFFNELVFGVIFSFVAGVMIFVAVDELLPTARKYGNGHREVYGFVAGMAIMAISLVVL